MKRPTVRDIAREAGVSLASVDRVLNRRAGIGPATVEKVQKAVERLGYVRDQSAANLARRREYRFTALLPEGPSQYIEQVKAALFEAAESHFLERMSLRVVSVPPEDPAATIRPLLDMDPEECDGIAIMAPETPQLRDAIGRLKGKGIAVVALVSNLPNSRCDYFVGIDNYAAGRTAGLLMGRMIKRSGQVLVATNSMRSRDSLERRLGFDAVVRQECPEVRVLPTVEFFNEQQRLAEIMATAFAKSRNIVGLYSMGVGNFGVLSALREIGAAQGITVIAHELTPAVEAALVNDEVSAVIAQNAGHLARSTLRVLRSFCDNVPIFEAQEEVRIEVILRENVPRY